jgi:hypothetical protein
MGQGSDWRKKTKEWHAEAGRCTRSLLTDFPKASAFAKAVGNTLAEVSARQGGLVMIGQTFTRTGRPKLVFRIVWRGSIKGVDCVRGVTLNGKFQTLTRLAEVVFDQAA